MLRLIYTFLGYLIQPFVLFLMWKKGRKAPGYRKRLNERYGFYGDEAKPQKKRYCCACSLRW